MHPHFAWGRGEAYPVNCKQPLDLVKRDFSASRLNPAVGGRLHFTRYGFTCTTFVINVHSRYIVGWRVMRSMARARGMPDGLTHHSDRGSQYRYPVIFLRNITGTRSCRCVTAHGWRRQA